EEPGLDVDWAPFCFDAGAGEPPVFPPPAAGGPPPEPGGAPPGGITITGEPGCKNTEWLIIASTPGLSPAPLTSACWSLLKPISTGTNFAVPLSTTNIAYPASV